MVEPQIYPEKAPGVAQTVLESMIEKEQSQKQRKRFSWFSKQQAKPAKPPVTKQLNKSAKQAETKLNKVNRLANGQQVEFASLAYLEYGLQWFENLIHILAPRLLIIGFVLSMVDLLTNGNLLNSGFFIYAWAIIQAMAVDATLPTMWRLAFQRFDDRKYVAGFILLLVGVALGGVVLAALSIQFLQQAETLTLQQTMSRLGLDPSVISYVRSVSVVALAAILSVLNRSKVKPAKLPALNSKQEDTKPLNEPAKQERDTDKLPVLNSKQESKPTTKPISLNTAKQERDSKHLQIQQLLNRGLGTTDVAKQAGVSKGYVSQVKKQMAV